ncbi:hypothetical protein PF008_g19291 [Phytophthora fragariae]|uniref:Uncharacterized protein n=1 Tax=Phytophthora fragariae TaxID=53985 RepID=A0A6G0R2Z7_9STRA|nr:hypothetical protein PF008_g19291 [Phytophthora fragariae]
MICTGTCSLLTIICTAYIVSFIRICEDGLNRIDSCDIQPITSPQLTTNSYSESEVAHISWCVRVHETYATSDWSKPVGIDSEGFQFPSRFYKFG